MTTDFYVPVTFPGLIVTQLKPGEPITLVPFPLASLASSVPLLTERIGVKLDLHSILKLDIISILPTCI